LPKFTDAPYVRSVDGVAHFYLTAMVNDDYVPVLDYEGRYVPPNIEVNAGDQIQVVYRNTLPPAKVILARGHSPLTNLHFHGLTTSPEPPEDDSLDMVPPGRTTEYVVDVGAGQPPGLYWYHPHPHGESAWQVGNGMSGALILDGLENEVPAVGGLRERVLIVRQAVSAEENEARSLAGRHFCGLKRMTPWQRKAFLARLARATPSAPASPASSVDETALTVNTLPAGKVEVGIAPGERELFRVLNATGDRNLDLSLGGAPLELVAEDGVPLADFPGSAPFQRVTHVVIPPAGRAEFIVTGSAAPAILRTAAYDTGPKGDKNPQASLLTLVNDGGGKPDDARLPRASGKGRAHLGFYRVPLSPPTVFRTVRLGEKSDGTDFRINGVSYDPADAPMFTARAGTVERWTLLNTTDETHDFHVHQVHFVVESVNGVPVPAAQRHWHDEVNVPYQQHHRDGSTTPGTAVILVDLRDPVIRGTFLFHCHILDHEDGGMMAKIRVI
jgi:FtsP/CotA-like multicopper oxidase with cupredoxin domain